MAVALVSVSRSTLEWWSSPTVPITPNAALNASSPATLAQVFFVTPMRATRARSNSPPRTTSRSRCRLNGVTRLVVQNSMPQNEIKLRDGRIVRSEKPLNLEMPFETVESFITPTKSFYVRTHFPIPKIDRDAWWLRVEGEVEKPFAINYE